MKRAWYVALLPFALVTWGIVLSAQGVPAQLATALWVVGVGLLGGAVISPVVLWRSPVFGAVYYCFVCMSAAAWAVWMSKLVLGWFGGPTGDDTVGMVAVIGGGVSFLGLLVAVPEAVWPWVRRRRWRKELGGEDWRDIGWVDRRLGDMRAKFSEIRAGVARETEGVERAIERMEEGIAGEVKKLQEVEVDVRKARQEIRDLEALGGMGEAQVEGLARMLKRRRYVDYGVGFALGVLGSALAQAMWLVVVGRE